MPDDTYATMREEDQRRTQKSDLKTTPPKNSVSIVQASSHFRKAVLQSPDPGSDGCCCFLELPHWEPDFTLLSSEQSQANHSDSRNHPAFVIKPPSKLRRKGLRASKLMTLPRGHAEFPEGVGTSMCCVPLPSSCA